MDQNDVLGIYILHFDSPIEDLIALRYGGPSHYVGISINVGNRISKHKAGKGSVVTKLAYARRIKFRVGFRAHLPELNQRVESAVTKDCERLCRYCG